jgi:hypothetical protein
MKYSVRAKPRIDTLPRLWTILNDGTVEHQEPDGMEILASMKRAVIVDGEARWWETCYCTPPLRRERSTVYDEFFTDLEAKPITNVAPPGGQRFWDYLREYSSRASDGNHEGISPTQIKYVPIRIL